MGLRLAPHICLFLALMDPFAILALLPATDAVSDQGNLSAVSDGEADAVSDQGNLSAVSDARTLRLPHGAMRV